MYVLQEDSEVLGVFDTPDLDSYLTSYYGPHTLLTETDVRDSGVEWVKSILADGEVYTLILLEFQVNEI